MTKIFAVIFVAILSGGFCQEIEQISAVPGDKPGQIFFPYIPHRNRHSESKMDSKELRSRNLDSTETSKRMLSHPIGDKGTLAALDTRIGNNIHNDSIISRFNIRKVRSEMKCLPVSYYVDPRFENKINVIQSALDDISVSKCLSFKPIKSRSLSLSLLMNEKESKKANCIPLYGKEEIYISKDCLTKEEIESSVLKWLSLVPTEDKRKRGNRISENKAMFFTDFGKLYCSDALPICCIISGLNGCSLFRSFTSKYCPESCKNCEDESSCGDNNPNCSKWGEENKCLANMELMREICPMTCGFCSPNDFCFDSASDCPDLVENGECERNPDYMIMICRESCKFCKRHERCKDRDSNCHRLTGAEECTKAGFRAICPHSCGLCSANKELGGECNDNQQGCIGFKGKGFCESHPKSMYKFCRRTCGFCKMESEEQ